MKARKEVDRVAKLAFKGSLSEGVVSENKVRAWIRALIKSKPRNLIEVLKTYQELIAGQLKKESALVESVLPLEISVKDKLIDRLEELYGKKLRFFFETNPELLGGVRIRVNDTVWDGSVSGKLENLKRKE
ncbi:MAG: F0F1 ATP synthase subunit delta [Patescibacteria group bacterium]|nr:F0F1 ATP synthase subunit delta [Patescibacteria group bacterium]